MAPAVCVLCRDKFDSTRFADHRRDVCWATDHQEEYRAQWTPSLTEYVKRSLDPKHLEPGWTKDDIISELIDLIEYQDWQHPTFGADWTGHVLPQHIKPKDLPFARDPKLMTRIRKARAAGILSLSGMTVVSPVHYPEGFRGAPDSTPRTLFRHRRGHLFVGNKDKREVLVYTDGACINEGMFALI